MNVQAGAAPYAGRGGWPDPDLLIGPQVYVGGQTDQQARAQFSMWSLFPTNLLISQNVLAWSPYALETYGNAELIAINQDPLASPAQRVVGGDLKFPCHSGGGSVAAVTAETCNAADPAQLWDFDAASGLLTSRAFASQGGVLEAADCATDDGAVVAVGTKGTSSCGGKNQQWTLKAGGTVINGNSGTCLDVYNFAGPPVDVWTCNGGSNQNFSFDASGLVRTADGGAGKPSMCLAATKQAPDVCSNVWGRSLSGGVFALGLVNNDVNTANVTCAADCFAAVLKGAMPSALRVRDLWQHADIGSISPPFSFSATIAGGGAAGVYTLTPA